MAKCAAFPVKCRVLSHVAREKQKVGLPFRAAFNESHIQDIIDKFHDPNSRVRLYCLGTTTQAMISQHLSEDSSLQTAVRRVNAERAIMKLEPSKGSTGSYSDARLRVPVEMLEELLLATGQAAEEQISKEWLWKQKYNVKLIDGTCFKMADTPENQLKFPQPKTQKDGVGFPMMRSVVISSLATGCVLGLSCGPEHGVETGEHALLRKIDHLLISGDIALGDAYFPSYFRLAHDMSRGVEGVYRLASKRKVDFSLGERLSSGDHLITWARPKRPKWMEKEEYDKVPASITVREVEVNISYAGHRDVKATLVTTLLDNKAFTKKDLGDLYCQRWICELDFRTIKMDMKLDHLKSRTPDMVEKELLSGLLTYNLTRHVMCDAGYRNNILPRNISFKQTCQTIQQYRIIWYSDLSESEKREHQLKMLDVIAAQKVGNRKGRSEPRVVKARAKKHKFMTKPRRDYQNQVAPRVSC